MVWSFDFAEADHASLGHGLVFLDELMYLVAGLILGWGQDRSPVCVMREWLGLGWRAAPIKE
jgi:hypothetical protein